MVVILCEPARDVDDTALRVHSGMDADYLPPELLGLVGALGLVHAPGLRRGLVEDLDALRARHPDLLLVSLVGDAELEILRISDLPDCARERGVELVRFPIAAPV